MKGKARHYAELYLMLVGLIGGAVWLLTLAFMQEPASPDRSEDYLYQQQQQMQRAIDRLNTKLGNEDESQ